MKAKTIVSGKIRARKLQWKTNKMVWKTCYRPPQLVFSFFFLKGVHSIAIAYVAETREIKSPIYGKRQTWDSSWEFLTTENKQIQTVENNSYG